MSHLTLFEIDSFTRALQPLTLAQVGSDVWLGQHDQLEKLNIQAHYEAMQGKHDEYVVEQIITQNKVEVLIHELLVIEAWKSTVFPHLLKHFSPITSVKAYMVLYHEATLCNLLELVMYHSSAVEGDSTSEAMVELGDYCARKVNLLISGAFKSVQTPVGTKEESRAAMSRTTEDTLKQQALDIGFSCAVCSISILRFLTDHINHLPLGVVSRILHTHDILLAMVPLVESPPWTRKNGKKLEKFSDQRWIEVRPQDAMLLTKLEGQVWLTIYNLIMDKSCRKQYQYNSHRKEVLIRLKRFFTDILMDQLPLLRELKRFIEELSLMEPPPPTASSMAIIEQVPEMREKIIKDGGEPKKLADIQARTVFANDEAARQRDIARLAATYNMDSFDDLLPAVCGGCGKQGASLKKCSRCKQESYCGRPCQVAAWKRHQKMCDAFAKSMPKKEEKKETTTTTTSPPAATAAAVKPSPSSTTATATTTTTTTTKSETKPSSTTTTAASSPAKDGVKQSQPPIPDPTPSSPPTVTPSTSTSTTATSSSTSAPSPLSTLSSLGSSIPGSSLRSTNSKAFASGKIVMLDADDEDGVVEEVDNSNKSEAKSTPPASTNPLDQMD